MLFHLPFFRSLALLFRYPLLTFSFLPTLLFSFFHYLILPPLLKGEHHINPIQFLIFFYFMQNCMIAIIVLTSPCSPCPVKESIEAFRAHTVPRSIQPHCCQQQWHSLSCYKKKKVHLVTPHAFQGLCRLILFFTSLPVEAFTACFIISYWGRSLKMYSFHNLIFCLSFFSSNSLPTRNSILPGSLFERQQDSVECFFVCSPLFLSLDLEKPRLCYAIVLV